MFLQNTCYEEILCSVLCKHLCMQRFLYKALLISESPLGAKFAETHEGVLNGFKLPQMSSLLEAFSGKPELLALSVASKKGFFIFSTNFANKCDLTALLRMLVVFVPGFRIQCSREHTTAITTFNCAFFPSLFQAGASYPVTRWRIFFQGSMLLTHWHTHQIS